MVKRVLVFSTDDHLYPAGGAEQAFGNISERLPHIEFDLICAKLRPHVKSFERVRNVNIYRMGFGIPKVDGIILALFGQFCAYKLMRKNSYDLVWSIMASYGAFSAVRVKKKKHLPFLLTLQEGDAFEYIYKRVRLVRRKFDEIFKTADGIQAISTYLLNWGRSMGYTKGNGHVIPNGVAIEAFTAPQTEENIRNTRASFGFPPDAFVLMTSSRLELKNGIGDVISALTQLPPQVCFVVCGSGKLEAEIKERVLQLGVASRVTFMGFVDPKELPRIMKASDAFIRPSLTEGLGNAFLEAMAARIPVIGTNAGGIPDFLKDGETGFMVEIKNPASVVKGVERVMALTAAQKKELLDRAEQAVRARYDWNLVSKEMEILFNKLAV
jgi:glycosyltransferase involved in cell wall biosynthesis